MKGYSLWDRFSVVHFDLPGRRLAGRSAVSIIAMLCAAPAARAITVIDVIPSAASNETRQNSEPSIAVNPLNSNQMVSGTFGGGPFWQSANGGTTWTSFGNIPNNDKSLAWRQDGVAPLAVTLNVITITPDFTDTLSTFQGGASNFGAAINISAPQAADQPWIRTGPGGQTYLASNNFNAENAGGRTATIAVSSNNGVTYNTPVVIETVDPAGGQDAPSVRTAVNGSTVYAAFTRFGTDSVVPGGDIFSNSQVVVVKSTNSGATFSSGTTAATTTGYLSDTNNSPLSLGQERTGGDIVIAVDPNNANRVVVAYADRTGDGLLQLKVVESTDGGLTWSATKFTTPSTVRSGNPGLSILNNGAIGLLYLSYDPITDSFSQHFVTTTDDFVTITDNLLGTQSNATPTSVAEPYLGDFYDLTSVDDTFFGIFSASNADNGTDALFSSVSFQRCFTGTPGTGNFALCDDLGNVVPFSIDPFVFSLNLAAVPEPATLTLVGTTLLGWAALRRRRA